MEDSSLMEGFLQKKKGKGIKGIRGWHDVYVLLTGDSLCYYSKREEGKSEPKSHVVKLIDIESVKYLQDEDLRRFDVKLHKDLKTMSFRTVSNDLTGTRLAQKWYEKIHDACAKFTQTPDFKSQIQMKDSNKFTALQNLFIKNMMKLEGKKDGDTSAYLELGAAFPSDLSILTYLLHTVLDERIGEFDSDFTVDEFIEAGSRLDQQKTDKQKRLDAKEREKQKALQTHQAQGIYRKQQNKTKEALLAANTSRRRGSAVERTAERPQWVVKAIEHGVTSGELSVLSSPDQNEPHSNPLVNMLRSKEFMRALSDVFASPHRHAHGYALRVLWIVMRGVFVMSEISKQMSTFIQVNCSGNRFTLPVHRSLLTILMSYRVDNQLVFDDEFWPDDKRLREMHDQAMQERAQLTAERDRLRERRPAPGALIPIHIDPKAEKLKACRPNYIDLIVRHHQCWPAIFASIRRSPLATRVRALMDINDILNQSYHNAMSLWRCGPGQGFADTTIIGPNSPASKYSHISDDSKHGGSSDLPMSSSHWQLWVWPMMADLPENPDPQSAEMIRSLSVLNMGVFTAVHLQFFVHSKNFGHVLTSSLDTLRIFSGYNAGSQEAAGSVLGALVSLLLNIHSVVFNLQLVQNKSWENLFELAKVAREYVFTTFYWNDLSLFAGVHAHHQRENSVSGPRGLSQRVDKSGRRLQEASKRGGSLLAGNAQAAHSFVELQNSKSIFDYIPGDNDLGVHFDQRGVAADLEFTSNISFLFGTLLQRSKEESSHIILKLEHVEKAQPLALLLEQEGRFWKDAHTLLDLLYLDMFETSKNFKLKKLCPHIGKFVSPWYNKGKHHIPINEENDSQRKQIIKDLRLAVFEGHAAPANANVDSLSPQLKIFDKIVKIGSVSAALPSDEDPSATTDPYQFTAKTFVADYKSSIVQKSIIGPDLNESDGSFWDDDDLDEPKSAKGTGSSNSNGSSNKQRSQEVKQQQQHGKDRDQDKDEDNDNNDNDNPTMHPLMAAYRANDSLHSLFTPPPLPPGAAPSSSSSSSPPAAPAIDPDNAWPNGLAPPPPPPVWNPTPLSGGASGGGSAGNSPAPPPPRALSPAAKHVNFSPPPPAAVSEFHPPPPPTLTPPTAVHQRTLSGSAPPTPPTPPTPPQAATTTSTLSAPASTQPRRPSGSLSPPTTAHQRTPSGNLPPTPPAFLTPASSGPSHQRASLLSQPSAASVAERAAPAPTKPMLVSEVKIEPSQPIGPWCEANRFGQYVPALRGLGAETLEDLTMLTEKDLQSFDMKVLHKRRFLDSLAELEQLLKAS